MQEYAISSRNPDIEEYIKNNDKLVILNKADLADEKENLKWIKYFNNKGIEAEEVNSNTGEGIRKSNKKDRRNILKKAKAENMRVKEELEKIIRVMVLGNTKCREVFIY